jgi:hypothetical protein
MIGMNYSFHSREWSRWDLREANPGFQYLVVWIKGWAEGTSWFGWEREKFNAWVWGNKTIAPEPVHFEDMPIAYRSEIYRPVLISNIFNRTENGQLLTTEWYGYIDGWEQGRMVTGESNAWNGFLIYQVPVDANLQDIRIAGWFGYFGTAWWNLQAREFEQNSLELERQRQEAEIQQQIWSGLRHSDRISERMRA